METAPTWIDAGMALEWEFRHSAKYNLTSRWFVFLHGSFSGFVILSGNADHSSFGGDDTCYSAEEVASAIERWGTPTSGLEATHEFLEALASYVRRVVAKGAKLETIRAIYLLDAMRARVAIARAEDEPPFSGYSICESAVDADATLLIPGEIAHDGPA